MPRYSAGSAVTSRLRRVLVFRSFQDRALLRIVRAFDCFQLREHLVEGSKIFDLARDVRALLGEQVSHGLTWRRSVIDQVDDLAQFLELHSQILPAPYRLDDR